MTLTAANPVMIAESLAKQNIHSSLTVLCNHSLLLLPYFKKHLGNRTTLIS